MEFFKETANQLIAEGYDRKDIICFAALNCHEMLTEAEGREITEACLKAIAETEQREMVAAKLQESHNLNIDSWKYACAINWRKLRSTQLCDRRSWLKHKVSPIQGQNLKSLEMVMLF